MNEKTPMNANEERDTTQPMEQDSHRGQYFLNWVLNADRCRLEGEIAYLNYLLKTHRNYCGASKVCTHSTHVGPPQNTPVSEASSC
jgi:hypothetical protein